MATVTGFTSTRMLAIENNSIVSGVVTGDNLMLTRQGGAVINAGNVRGPTGTPGVSQAQLDAAFPAGMIVDYINITPPAGWLSMTGQSVANGQTLYPALWAVIPAAMKSGSTIVMPDTRGKVTVGYHSGDTQFDTILETGGEKTHTITIPELPSHTHVQDTHNHTQNSHNHAQDSHNHTQQLHNHGQDAHYHASGSLYAVPTTNDTHSHAAFAALGAASFAYSRPGTTNGGFQGAAGSTIDLLSSTHTGEPTDTLSRPFHTHGVSGNTEWQVATNQGVTALNNQATATNQAATATNITTIATNQATGGGTAMNVLQPYVVFLKIIRAI